MVGVPNSVLGTSIALVNGDFGLVNGDLALASGTDNFGQALQVIVETPFGSDPINVTYGLDVAAIFTVAASVSSVKDVIRLNLMKSLSADDRIQQIDQILFDDEDGFAAFAPEFADGDPGRIARVGRLWHAVIAATTVAGGQQAVVVAGVSP